MGNEKAVNESSVMLISIFMSKTTINIWFYFYGTDILCFAFTDLLLCAAAILHPCNHLMLFLCEGTARPTLLMY